MWRVSKALAGVCAPGDNRGWGLGVITNADQQIPDCVRKSMLVFDLAGNGFGPE